MASIQRISVPCVMKRGSEATETVSLRRKRHFERQPKLRPTILRSGEVLVDFSEGNPPVKQRQPLGRRLHSTRIRPGVGPTSPIFLPQFRSEGKKRKRPTGGRSIWTRTMQPFVPMRGIFY